MTTIALLDRRRLGLARAGVTTLFVADAALFASWVSRIPRIKADLRLSDAQLGLALFAIAVGAVAAMVITARRLASHDEGNICFLTSMLLCVSLPLPALARDLPTLAGGLLLLGAGHGGLGVAANHYGWGLSRRMGRPIIGSLHAAHSLGGVAGGIAGGLASAMQLLPVLHFAAVAGCLAVVCAVVTELLPPVQEGVAAPEERVRLPARTRSILAWLGVLAACAALIEGAVADWSTLYLDDWTGAGAGTAALGFSAFSLGMVGVRLVTDRLVTWLGTLAVRRLGGVLVAAGVAAALTAGRPWPAIVAFGLVGAGLAVVFPILIMNAGRLPSPTSQAVAAVTASAYFAYLAGPPLIGWVSEATTLRAALWLVAVTGVVVALVPAAAEAGRGG